VSAKINEWIQNSHLISDIAGTVETLFDQLLPFETPLTPIAQPVWQKSPRQS